MMDEERVVRLLGDTPNKTLSKILKCSVATAARKIHGQTEFTRTELQQIKDFYKLSDDLFSKIFFVEPEIT